MCTQVYSTVSLRVQHCARVALTARSTDRSATRNRDLSQASVVSTSSRDTQACTQTLPKLWLLTCKSALEMG